MDPFSTEELIKSSQNQPWWGDKSLADLFTRELGFKLGDFYNDQGYRNNGRLREFGPAFGYEMIYGDKLHSRSCKNSEY